MLDEFKKFAMRGNMLDLAIGVIIGSAFSKVVTSLVSDLLMPPIGWLVGGIDLRAFTLVVQHSVGGQPLVEIRYGAFLNTLIDFLVIAWVIFITIKTLNRIPGAHIPFISKRLCPQCVMEIPCSAIKCGHCGSTVPKLT